MGAGGELSAQVIAALSRGDRIQAIKLLRQAGGKGLKEAMIALDAYAARQAGNTASPRDAMAAALRDGNTIEAIKRMREANPGMDLRSAKDAVEALQHGDRPATAPSAASTKPAVQAHVKRTPTVVEGDSGGVGIIITMLVIAAAAVAWFFLKAA